MWKGNMKTQLKHLLTIEQLTDQEIMELINLAKKFKASNNDKDAKNKLDKTNEHTVVGNLFFETSTRTHKSFEIAEKKLGIETIDLNVATSAVQKGESLYDTVLTMNAIGVDALVIRHPDIEYYKPLIESQTIKCSIINGGDGSGEHPTQSLLDLMTIYEEFEKFKGLKIAIVGDLKHSRVARSNMKILKRLGAEIYFAGPREWYVEQEFGHFGKFIDIDTMIDQLDVVMFLRVQLERHTEQEFKQNSFLEKYGLSNTRYAKLKHNAIVMHPCPVNRDVEMGTETIEAPKSRLVAQMANGVFMRMAILRTILRDKF
ncbi:aspartate carbamoyltransferase catalytic subunit [Entomoplasma luminosum]